MAIRKKSLMGKLSATKKAIVVSNAASTTPVSAPKLQTAKPGPGIGHRLNSASHIKLIAGKKK